MGKITKFEYKEELTSDNFNKRVDEINSELGKIATMESSLGEKTKKLETELFEKQDALTPGDNITISPDNTISAKDTVYDDTQIKDMLDEICYEQFVLRDDAEEEKKLNEKHHDYLDWTHQDKLAVGSGIDIADRVVEEELPYNPYKTEDGTYTYSKSLITAYTMMYQKNPEPISNFKGEVKKPQNSSDKSETINLSWTNPEGESYKGVKIVDNFERMPKHPNDGKVVYDNITKANYSGNEEILRENTVAYFAETGKLHHIRAFTTNGTGTVNNDESQYMEIPLTGRHERPEAPLIRVSSTSVEIEPIEHGLYKMDIEETDGKYTAGQWQEKNIFDNLSQDKKYRFVQKKKKSGLLEESQESLPVEIKLDKRAFDIDIGQATFVTTDPDEGTKSGFFGEVTSDEFITGNDLAVEIGLINGHSYSNDTKWLKFIHDLNGNEQKILFVAKNPIRYAVSWNDLNTLGAVYGEKIITIKNNKFKVRLMKTASKDYDPAEILKDGLDREGIAERIAKQSEWNDLMLPIHIDTTNKRYANSSFYYSGYIKYPPSWHIDYTNDDLYELATFGQDFAVKDEVKYPFVRGVKKIFKQYHIEYGKFFEGGDFNLVEIGLYKEGFTTNTRSDYFGWRPVLELVQEEK